MTRRNYWEQMIANASLDNLAKDLHPAWDIATQQYTSHSALNDKALEILKQNTDMNLVLDFGTGLGRNHEYLKSLYSKVNGFDLPPMIRKGRTLKTININIYTSDWNEIIAEEYDLVYECICFQYMDLDDLKSKLTDIARISKYLYINARSYNDVGRNWATSTGGTNIASIIYQLGLFSVAYSDISFHHALQLLDESHFQILFKSNIANF